MVHQYSPDTPTTPIDRAYDDLMTHIPNPQQRNMIVDKALGNKVVDSSKVNEDIISLFNPHADYIRAYNERSVKEEKKALREKERQLYNEAGQAYEHIWKNDSFKKIHDPLSSFI
jgi:hypothetical protein